MLNQVTLEKAIRDMRKFEALALVGTTLMLNNSPLFESGYTWTKLAEFLLYNTVSIWLLIFVCVVEIFTCTRLLFQSGIQTALFVFTLKTGIIATGIVSLIRIILGRWFDHWIEYSGLLIWTVTFIALSVSVYWLIRTKLRCH